jgi:hypothetical protein
MAQLQMLHDANVCGSGGVGACEGEGEGNGVLGLQMELAWGSHAWDCGRRFGEEKQEMGVWGRLVSGPTRRTIGCGGSALARAASAR